METVVAPPPLRKPGPRLPAPPPVVRRAASVSEIPLLPPLLAGPAAFLWLWVAPIAVLLALNVQGYTLIEGNMTPEQRTQALWLGTANLANLLAGAGLFFVTRRFASHGASAAANLIARTAPALTIQAGYLWFASVASSAIPANVAAWIYPPPRFFFNQFSFAMVPLFVGILHLACVRAGAAAGKAIAVNLGLAVGAPIAVFTCFHGLQAFSPGLRLPAVVMATVMITFGVTMFIGLVRALVLGLRTAQRGGVLTERLAIVVFALAMPLGGLALNRAIPFPADFQAWEVYALTIANAAILLFASWRHARSPALSFGLLCGALPFSLYFFLVFLPYTPLSVFAVLAAGAGFLVLTPTLLFVLHFYLLNKARQAWRARRGTLPVALVGAACFLILPAAIVGRATADRAALNAALAHVYSPAITGHDIVYSQGVPELRRALRSHRSYKNGIHTPLLSDFYAWWVFNHLVLSDEKLERLERLFTGAVGSRHTLDPLRHGLAGNSVREHTRMPRANPPPRDVFVRELITHTRPGDAHSRIVTLALTLQNPRPAAGEYIAKLPLPAGVFVGGFRLHIDGVAVPGRVFEKKTALWVYTMIRDTERRDPGLLFYNSPEELELRVYPVPANGASRVEIDFLVPGAQAEAGSPPESLVPAAVLAHIGKRTGSHLASDPRGAVLSLDPATQRQLPAVTREPYLHVIVDRSLEHGYTRELGSALRTLREKFPAARRGRITLAHHDVVDLVPQLTALDALAAGRGPGPGRRLPAAGGFALDLALAHALRRHRDLDLDRAGRDGGLAPRPVFVILSAGGTKRALDLELTDHWLDLLPEFELHELTASGSWITHREPRTAAVPLVRRGDSVRPVHPARAVRFAASANDEPLRAWSPAANAWRPLDRATTQPPASAWARAVALQLQQQDHSRSPGDAALDLKALVEASRASGILLAGASYIVVENAAQWRMLERSEQQKLTQNAALDFRETPAPPAVWVGVAFAAWLGFRRWRRSAAPRTSCSGAP